MLGYKPVVINLTGLIESALPGFEPKDLQLGSPEATSANRDREPSYSNQTTHPLDTK